MSDSDPEDEKSTPLPEQPKAQDESTPESPNRDTIIEQARKFLQEEEIRDADTDKKIAFLEQKGLLREEIDGLIGVVRNVEASSPASIPETTSSLPSSPSSNFTPPNKFPQIQSAQTSTQMQPHTPSTQPPIITYPEFLTTSHAESSPLITKPRLLTTLYLFSSLSFLIYGTSNFVVSPMLSTLTESRLSLASTAKQNLQKLIEKLEGVVSVVPAGRERGKLGLEGAGEKEGDESEDEDPSELFHRDIGVQTSLPSSPTLLPNFPSQDDSSSPGARIPQQAKTLNTLRTSLTSLLETSSSEGHDNTELEGTIGILKYYLDGLAYVPTASYGGIYGGTGLGYGGSGGKAEVDDEIARVKSSIRGVKGVLLSARSFPGGLSAGGGR